MRSRNFAKSNDGEARRNSVLNTDLQHLVDNYLLPGTASKTITKRKGWVARRWEWEGGDGDEEAGELKGDNYAGDAVDT